MSVQHLVLIGLDFSRNRYMGDKNFWIDMIPLLAAYCNSISVISVKKNLPKIEEYSVGKCRVRIVYVSPVVHIVEDVPHREKGFFRKSFNVHFLTLSFEKILAVPRIMGALRSLDMLRPITNLHLMDNFGLGNRLIAALTKKLGVKVSVSAISYQGKNPLLYHAYLIASYKHPRIKVIAYSRALRELLIGLGIKASQCVRVPWGVRVDAGSKATAESEKTEMKVRIGLPRNKALFLWSGYIQQVQERDFLFALSCAREARKSGFDACFFFAFKEGYFKAEMARFDEPHENIYVRSTDKALFDLLKKAADVFYSPIVNSRCIVAPPLTWLEMLACGVPILTTMTGGADECIANDKTGYIARGREELIRDMHLLSDDYRNMGHSCIEKIRSGYDIRMCAALFVDSWSREKEG
jgi:glycosyltransferase involved in cell wall biosynthesis